MRSQLLLAGAISILVFAGVLTSAATLNGINTSLGADAVNVGGCDPDGVTITYQHVYNTTTDAYDISGVNVSDVAVACQGLSYSITVEANGGASGADATGSVPAATSFSAGLSSNLDANLVDKVAIVIG